MGQEPRTGRLGRIAEADTTRHAAQAQEERSQHRILFEIQGYVVARLTYNAQRANQLEHVIMLRVVTMHGEVAGTRKHVASRRTDQHPDLDSRVKPAQMSEQ